MKRFLFFFILIVQQAGLRSATDLYLRTGQFNATLAGDQRPAYQLSLTRGALASSFSKDTAAGAQTPPSTATQFTFDTAADQNISWMSPPLNAATIAGNVTFNLWAYENAGTANAGITAELLRLDLYGNILSVIAAVVVPAAELGLSPGSAQNWTVAPISTTLSNSDRLGIRAYRDNVGVMAAGSITLRVNGPTAAADGDSWVRLTEAVTELAVPIGDNLARNWDAEAGANGACAAPPATVGAPGWQTLAGNFTVVPYCANFINVADPGPAARGVQLFMGGSSAGGTVTYDSALQSIDVSSRAAFIDSGWLTYNLSAWIGGYQTQNDRASLTLAQVDGSGNTLSSVTLGPVTNLDRSDITSELFRQAGGALVSGTRTLRLLMEFFYTSGSSADGYIDNLSVSLSPTAGLLPEAVDYPGLSFSNGGAAPWHYQTAYSTNDNDAARSGVTGDGQSSWMQVTFGGPGIFSFYWSVSSESTFDFLKFYVDGVEHSSITGTTAWAQVQATLGPGFHTLRWSYEKDGTLSAGQDAGWVDRMTFLAATPTPSPTPLPAFSCLPAACGTWGTIGSALPMTGGLKLTEDFPDQAGGALVTSWLDLNQAFDQSFELFLGANAVGGEGVAFVLHNDPRGYYAMGQSGQYLGYGGAGGISPSLAVEVDTYSQAGNGDLASHHVAVNLNGATNHNGAGPVSADPFGASILDSRTHVLRLTWDPVGKQLGVYIDGYLRLNYSGDIVSALFGGNACVYWGFTGSTSSAAYNLQIMRPLGCWAGAPAPDLCAAAWTLNGATAAGTAATGITLTAAAGGQAGSSFFSSKVDLLSAFDYSFRLNFGTNNPGGADGMAFILHNDSRGTAALGGIGAGLGYAGAGSIAPSVAHGLYSYLPANTSRMEEDGSQSGAGCVRATNCPFVFGTALANGVDRVYRVVWNPINTRLDIYVDGSLIHQYTRDLVDLDFGGESQVRLGFSAATGGLVNRHWFIPQCGPQPTPTPSYTPTPALTSTPTPTATPVNPPPACGPAACGNWLPRGSATAFSGGTRLTDAVANQRGAAWMDTRIDLAQPFDLSYDIYLGEASASGDGLAFVLHNDSRGFEALGESGPSMGFGDTGSGSRITPSLALEVDMLSQGGLGDPSYDHLAVNENGAMNHNGAAPVAALPSLGDLNTGRSWRLRLVWDPSSTRLEAYFNGILRLSYTKDVVNQLFGGNACVYAGFSAANGGLNSQQWVRPVSCLTPIPTPDWCASTWTLNGNAAGAVPAGITLTANLANQRGSAFHNSCLDLAFDFDVAFRFNFIVDADPADGMALVFHDDPRGLAALGGGGGALGYSDAVRIAPSVAVAIYNFGAPDHFQFEEGGSQTGPGCSYASPCPANVSSLSTGTDRILRALWSASQSKLEVYLDNVLISSYTRDLIKVLGGRRCVTVGLTAATGSSFTQHWARPECGLTALSPTFSPTLMPTLTQTLTLSPSPSQSPSSTQSPTLSPSFSGTPSASPSPSPTPTFTPYCPISVLSSLTSTVASAATRLVNFDAGSGANRLLIASLAFNTGVAATAASYAGIPMSPLLASDPGTVKAVELWYLVNPPTGSNAFAVSSSSSTFMHIALAGFGNVDQATPFGATITDFNTASSSVVATGITTTAAGSLLYGHICVNSTSAVLSPGSGQTQLWNAVQTGQSLGDTEPTGAPGAYGMDYSFSVSSVVNQLAAEIRPAGCPGPATPTWTPSPSPTDSPQQSPTPSPSPQACAGPANTGAELPDAGLFSGATAHLTAWNNWQYFPDPCVTAGRSSAQARSGAWSFMIDDSACGGGFGGYYIQNLCGINTACAYTFCAWVRTTNSGGTGVYLAIEPRDASGNAVGTVANILDLSSVGSWTQFCATINPGSYGVGFDHVRVVLGNQSGAPPASKQQAWFDDISFTGLGACAPTATATPSASSSVSPSFTFTATASQSPSPSPSPSPTATSSASGTPSWTPTLSPTPSLSRTPSHTDSPTSTLTLTTTASPSRSPTPTQSPTHTRTSSPTPSSSITPSPTPTPACVGFDLANSGSASTSSISVPLNVSGVQRLLLVQVAINSTAASASVTSATYNAVPMTFLRRDVGPLRSSELWYQVAPATGNHSIVVNLAASHVLHVGAINYTGVNQSTPIGATAYLSEPSAASHSIGLNVASANGRVVGHASWNASGTVVTLGGGQTQRWIRTPLFGSEGDDISFAAPGLYTLSYSMSPNDAADMQVVELISANCNNAPPTPSPSESPSPSFSPTETPTQSPSGSPTGSPTQTTTRSPTSSLTQTLTTTHSPTSSLTQTLTTTHSPTSSLTQTLTTTHSPTSSLTQTLTTTHSPTSSLTQTLTTTHSPTSSLTQTLTTTHSPTSSLTQTLTTTHSPTSSLTQTLTITDSPTSSLTLTLTHSPTASLTPTPTATHTPTSSMTPTLTTTDSPTSSLTLTTTQSPTSSLTQTLTATHSPTGSLTQTLTLTDSPTSSPTLTTTHSPTSSLTQTLTTTHSPTSSLTQTLTTTHSPTGSLTQTLTTTSSPTSSLTLTATHSPTPSLTQTSTDSPTTSLTWTPTTSPSPTVTASPSGTLTWTFTLSRTPSDSPTPSPSLTGTSSPSLTSTATPTASGTLSASPSLTRTFSPTESATPSGTPSRSPTGSPTPSPSASGTATPAPSSTSSRTPLPTATVSETFTPSPQVSATPTFSPAPPSPWTITVRIYDQGANLVRSLAGGTLALPVAGVAFTSNPFDPSQGLLTISDGAWSMAFDGRADNGQLLQGGIYQVVVESARPGETRSAGAVLTLVGSQSSGISLLKAWPNPLRPGGGTVLNFSWLPAVEVEIGIYNLAGELVLDLGRKSLPPASWDATVQRGVKVGGGIYLLRARIPGERKAAFCKIVVLQ